MIVPIPHYPSEADPRNFLNFNERQMVATALEKLAVVPETNLTEVFSVINIVINFFFSISNYYFSLLGFR